VDPEHWKRIEEIFHAALALPADRRAVYISETCGHDPSLRSEVESLLRSTATASDFLETPAQDGRHLPTLQDLESDVGRRVGPYRLVRLLGSGGMGAVYLGEREDDVYRGSVAIKIVKRGMETDGILRRFRTERQALASLTHPNIARLLDGGSLEDGRPYLVMERVDGTRIDRFCDERALSITERIRLFRRVCGAAQHAHQNLIIHRDLKPSNILITEESDPKLLDFGIAKVLEGSGSGDPTAGTMEGARLMTLDYASPEQVRGEAITTSSDIYSLGVILYELLTGHRPHRIANLSHQEAWRRHEGTPEKPSTMVGRVEVVPHADGTSETVAPETVSRARGTTLERLRRRLRGDLDNIVLMALREEPERRYRSVEQLSLDLDRFVRGHPVMAREDTFAYRTSKFVRRHRAGVLAAILLVASLMLGIVGTWTQARVASRERDAAETARMAAEDVTRFLIDLFEVSDPGAGQGKNTPAIEFLDRAAVTIESELRERPVVRAALMHSIGSIYRNIGAYDRAGSHLEEALAIRERELDAGHPDIAASLRSLGELRQLQGRFTDALALMQRSLDLQRPGRGASHTELAQSLNGVAVIQMELGNLDEARRLLLEALRMAREEPDVERGILAATLNNLAALGISNADYEEAVRLASEALSVQEREYGTDHPDRATSLYHIAVARQRQGKLEQAAAAFGNLVRIREKTHGADHALTAVARSSLGITLRGLGEEDRAEAHLRAAVDVLRRVGETHPALGSALCNLAELLVARNDLDGAEALYGEALETVGASLGQDHALYAGVLNNLGFIQESRGNIVGAEETYRRVLEIDRRRLPKGHPDLATSLENLGRSCLARRRLEEAEHLYREVLDVLRDAREMRPGAIDPPRMQLAIILVERRKFDEAETLLLESARAIRERDGEDSEEYRSVRTAMEYLYDRRGESEKAAITK